MKRILSIISLAGALTVVFAEGPAWWAQRGVIKGEGRATDDFAVLNQGQLKNLARAASLEFESGLALQGGAGSAITSLIQSWNTSTQSADDFAVVNLGQLKHVAGFFYRRLQEAGKISDLPAWVGQTGSDNSSAANIGQAKMLFSFTSTGQIAVLGQQSGSFDLTSPPAPVTNASSNLGSTGGDTIVCPKYIPPTQGTGTSPTAPAVPLPSQFFSDYVLSPSTPTWTKAFYLQLDKDGNADFDAGTNSINSDYCQPSLQVSTDHWMLIRAKQKNYWGPVNPETNQKLLLYHRATEAAPWAGFPSNSNPSTIGLPEKRGSSTIGPPLQTQFGTRMALKEELITVGAGALAKPVTVLTLAVSTPDEYDGYQASTVDIFRYRSDTKSWVAEGPPIMSRFAVRDLSPGTRPSLKPGPNALAVVPFSNMAEIDWKGFGDSLAFSGDYLFVSAPNCSYRPQTPQNPFLAIADNWYPNAGLVAVFKRLPTGKWSALPPILNPYATPGGREHFGSAIVANGSCIAIGAAAPEGPSIYSSVYLYSYSATAGWQPTGRFFDSDGRHRLGNAIAMLGATVIVGAPVESLQSNAETPPPRAKSTSWK